MKIKNVICYGRLGKEVADYLTEKLPDISFHASKKGDLVKENLDNFDAYISFDAPPEDYYGNLKWVHSLGGGVDRFLYKKEFPKDIILTRTTGDFGRKIGEFALSRVLAHFQNIRTYGFQQRESKWKQHNSTTLKDKRIIILGTGVIGTKVADIFKRMDCKVYGISLSGSMKKGFDAVAPISKFEEIAPKGDILIIVAPLTKSTDSLVDYQFLSKFKDIFLINVGRGQIVDTPSLIKAMDEGIVKGAALDVFNNEPLNDKSNLWDDERLFISPHVAALTSVEEGAESFIESYYNIINGFNPDNRIDMSRGY
jgi:phosphoglycerate dehydrogenase-like enzyme